MVLEKVRKTIRFDHMEVAETIDKTGGMVAFWQKTGNVVDIVAIYFTIELRIRNLVD